MTFAIDDRARVPFALVGVVILLTSSGFALTLSASQAPTNRVQTTDAIRETVATTRSAVHGAVRRAAAQAARNPVVTPANTSYGHVVSPTAPFRSSLRIRIAVAVREAIATLGDGHGNLKTNVVVPAITSPTALRSAIQNISITRVAGERPMIRVTVRNLRFEAIRGNQVIASVEHPISVSVVTPVLALHEKVAAFQHQLNQSVWKPGLARQITSRLYPIVWTRAYAQYGGAPIENVLANRHLEIAANGALLATQRSIFGAFDPRGVQAHRRAAIQTGLRDLVAAADIGLSRWTQTVLSHRGVEPSDPGPMTTLGGNHSPASLSVGLDRYADDAFANFVDRSGNQSLTAVLDQVFTLTAHLEAMRTVINQSRTPAPQPTGWTLVNTTHTTNTRVRPGESTSQATVEREAVISSIHRQVTISTTTTKTWRNGQETTTTSGTRRKTVAVDLRIYGTPTTTPTAPGAVTGGPNRNRLDEVADSLTSKLFREYGGVRPVAINAARGPINHTTVIVDIPIPDGVAETVYLRVATLRRHLRNISVKIPAPKALAGPVTPRLQAAVTNRSDLVLRDGGPYETLTEKAVVLARHVYLNRLGRRIQDHRRDQSSLLAEFGDILPTNGIDARHLQTVGTFLDETRTETGTTPLNLSVVGVPPYLTRARLTNETVPGLNVPYYPMGTRNVNLISVPYGDVARAVTASVLESSGDVSLGTAGRALRIANQTLSTVDATGLSTNRSALRRLLGDRLTVITVRMTTVIQQSTPLSKRDAREAVTAGVRQWESVHARVSAVVNGSVVTPIETAIATQTELTARQRDRLQVRLRRVLRETVTDLRLPSDRVTPVAKATQGFARQLMERTVENTIEQGQTAVSKQWTASGLTAPRGGVPLLPVPGYWYATANAWKVSIRGEYARFAVSAPASAPLNGLGEHVEYVRRRAAVSLDVDDDGDADVLGRNRRIGFAVETAVIVVVPPGRGGIADVDGTRDERSPGWNETARNL